MINSRLIKTVPTSMRYVGFTVLCNWIGLIFNILAIFSIGYLIESTLYNTLTTQSMLLAFTLIGLSIGVRFITNIKSAHYAYLSSSEVKNKLRHMIYTKLLGLGINYNEKISTSKVVQMSSEGVEQIEIYFSRYLPQFFYSLLAPLTLFTVLSFINIKIAFVLLICVPLIPISIIAVNKLAKKLLAKYWGIYTGLGDHFLDNLQGLTTLKIYQDDAHCNEQMNKDAEHFRKITMKVLTMQLNSITLMDLIAYGGAAIGIIGSLVAFNNQTITLSQTIIFLLLTSEFFIPLRLLGSFFHVAMNGVAAANTIFELLDQENEDFNISLQPFSNGAIHLEDVSFCYEPTRPILKNISMTIPEKGFISLVGESGCGKSTIASLIMGFHRDFQGSIRIDDLSITEFAPKAYMQNVCIIKHQNYLFKGSIRDNLKIAHHHASDSQMEEVLKQVNLYEFIMSQGGLDFQLRENASNLSGGQAQRLSLARALLHNAAIYIFDEATSNIDAESESIIYDVIHNLAQSKTVILISHRLANVKNSDHIFVLKDGYIIEQGTHTDLVTLNGTYCDLYTKQSTLEKIYQGGAHNA